MVNPKNNSVCFRIYVRLSKLKYLWVRGGKLGILGEAVLSLQQ